MTSLVVTNHGRVITKGCVPSALLVLYINKILSMETINHLLHSFSLPLLLSTQMTSQQHVGIFLDSRIVSISFLQFNIHTNLKLLTIYCSLFHIAKRKTFQFVYYCPPTLKHYQKSDLQESSIFQGGPKGNPFLQKKRGYCSIESTPRNVVLEVGDGIT